MENFTTNKNTLVNDIEFYSDTVRTLQDQKEKLEDSFKNRIDILVADNKSLEQTFLKNLDQINFLEKEKKEIKEKDHKKYIEMKDKYNKEKEALEIKYNESTKRFAEINKEKEHFKKENDTLKKSLDKLKLSYEELVTRNLKMKEKRETELNLLEEKYKSYIDKLESSSNEKIKNYQNKLKNLNIIMERNEIIKETEKIEVFKTKLRTRSLIGSQINRIRLENKNNILDNLNYETNKINPSSPKNVIQENLNISVDNQNNISFEQKENQKETYNNEVNNLNNNFDTLRKNDSEIFRNINEENKILESLNNINTENETENLNLPQIEDNFNHNIPLDFALDQDIENDLELQDKSHTNNINKKNNFATEEKNNEILTDEENNMTNSKNKPKLLKRRTTFFRAAKINSESLKKRLKQKRQSKIISAFKGNKNDIENITKEKIQTKTSMKLIKRMYEDTIKELQDKIFVYENKQNNLEDKKDFEHAEHILKINDFKAQNLILVQEKKSLLEQVDLLNYNLVNLENNKNEYINKIKTELEQTEVIAAQAKLSVCQIVFEKETEILKYRNYSRKLKTNLKILKDNNEKLIENVKNTKG